MNVGKPYNFESKKQSYVVKPHHSKFNDNVLGANQRLRENLCKPR